MATSVYQGKNFVLRRNFSKVEILLKSILTCFIGRLIIWPFYLLIGNRYFKMITHQFTHYTWYLAFYNGRHFPWLNIIESVWSWLVRRIYAEGRQFNNEDESNVSCNWEARMPYIKILSLSTSYFVTMWLFI